MTELERMFILARRQAIAVDYAHLNDMQQQGVMATEGPLLLLAGAGSGKTTVLIHRVANLLRYGRGSDSDEIPIPISEDEAAFLEEYAAAPTPEQRPLVQYLCAVEPARPWEVLAITFTNKAANELKERLERMLGEEARDVWASTFHSACVRILRRDIEQIGYSRDFTIYDTDDSKRVIKDCLKELDLDEKTFPVREILSVISRAKDEMMLPEDFRAYWEKNNDWRKTRIARVYSLYAKKLRDANALDFDDIILLTVQLLQSRPDVREYYQRKFRYVLVDEYQDTNHLQYLLTSLLAGGYQNICVVGDDDQSIYRFRGANIENILSFEKQYRGARVIRLEQNYRSTQNILDAANAVIRHNMGRKGKTLWTRNGAGEKVLIKTTFNEGDEANFVVGQVMMNYNRGLNWRDHAVLYRMNAQSNALEYAMKRNAIPYKVVGGTKFFDRAEVKDMLAYLCVLNNPMDDLRLRRIINNPTRGIGAATMDRVAELASEQGASLYEIIRNADLFPVLKSAASKLLKFADLIDNLRRAGATLALPEFYDEVLSQSGYVLALEEKNDMESRGRIENVQELKSNILGFLEQSPEDATLSGFLNEIALYTDLDSVEAGDNCVTMMTIHSAKGLEFPVVYVVGMEEGIFPGSAAMYDEEELEEERRLCYVAMTRAREKLVMTNARQRMLYGRTSSNKASRFLEEIPEEDLRWESKPEPRFGASREEGFGGSRWDDDFGDSPFGGSSYGGSYGGYGSRRSAGEGAGRDGSAPSARSGGYVSGGVHTYRNVRPASQPLRTDSRGSTSAAPVVELLRLAPGDQVEHTAFGRGTVVSVKPMGGDALAEVNFADGGTKRLMLKAAGKHMKKL